MNTVTSLISRSPWYTCAALLNEATTLAHMAARDGHIYHVLYGDTDLRFLPYFNGWRGHQVVSTFHQPPHLLEELKPQWANHLRSLVAVGTSQTETLAQWLQPDRIRIIPHPVDVTFFTPSQEKDHSGILTVGIHLRDFALLADVAPLVREMSGAAWTVVAPHSAEEVKQAGVRWLANLTDAELLHEYQEASVCALPLTDATANNALLEAMACGLPIVVSDVGSIRDYVDESCAVLVPPSDRPGFARAVVSLLQDHASRRQLARAARDRALSFGISEIQARLHAFYVEIGRS